MDDCKLISTPVECRIKLFQDDETEKVDPTLFKSLVRCLLYLTCTMPDILYVTRLVSSNMEIPITTHFKAAKRILRYLKNLVYSIRFPMIINSLDIVIVTGPKILMIEKAQLVLYFLYGYPRKNRLSLSQHMKLSI